MSRERMVPARELADVIEHDPDVLALVGEDGGRSLVTGNVQMSSVLPGALAVETEHGTLYLDADGDVTVTPV